MKLKKTKTVKRNGKIYKLVPSGTGEIGKSYEYMETRSDGARMYKKKEPRNKGKRGRLA